MLFEDDVVVVVVEQDGDGAELRGGAARFGDLVRLQDVNLPEQSEIQLMLLYYCIVTKRVRTVQISYVTEKGQKYSPL